MSDENSSKFLIMEKAESDVIAVVGNIKLPEYTRVTPFSIHEGYRCDEKSGKIMDENKTVRLLTRVELTSLKAGNTECTVVNADGRVGLMVDTALEGIHIVTILRGHADLPKELPDYNIAKYQVPYAFYVEAGGTKFDLLQLTNNALFLQSELSSTLGYTGSIAGVMGDRIVVNLDSQMWTPEKIGTLFHEVGHYIFKKYVLENIHQDGFGIIDLNVAFVTTDEEVQLLVRSEQAASNIGAILVNRIFPEDLAIEIVNYMQQIPTKYKIGLGG